MRISRQVASMSAADSRPCPRSVEKTWVSRSESVSNTASRLSGSMATGSVSRVSAARAPAGAAAAQPVRSAADGEPGRRSCPGSREPPTGRPGASTT